MLLNRLEYALMNNPVRAASQRHVEGRLLRRMGGRMPGGRALEIGCGRGVGAAVVRDVFRADVVHGFDLDRRMVALARDRHADADTPTAFWVGDALQVAAPDAHYDAVFDFGVLHHIPDWRGAVHELHRVLRPGGRFYAEEVLAPAIRLTRHLLTHPQHDRFDVHGLVTALREAGFTGIAHRSLGRWFTWVAATRPAASVAGADG